MDDLVIQHARICDGTGTASFIGTLGVTDGRITSLGPDTGLAAKRTINADGLVLAPGFIDPHTHYAQFIAVCRKSKMVSMAREDLEEARVFAGDEPCHGEERRHASTRFDALQSVRN